MKINAEFDQRVVVHSESLDWVDSPMKGVQRRPLDRVGGEIARATTIVRYAPGSHFSPHVHTGGEEFIVLDGVFQDEHGDFPAGSYIRNPPQSSHTPGSEPGCVIFVKLWQFDPENRTHVRLNMDAMGAVACLPGVAKTPLYKDKLEDVALYRLEPGAVVQIAAPGGAEALVLEGSAKEGGENLVRNSWLRTPVDTALAFTAGPDGAKIWIKTGHMNDVDNQVERVLQVS
jgi:hypothetical protein